MMSKFRKAMKLANEAHNYLWRHVGFRKSDAIDCYQAERCVDGKINYYTRNGKMKSSKLRGAI